MSDPANAPAPPAPVLRAPGPAAGPRRPPAYRRVAAVWFRHVRVYGNFFVANATPAVFEPIFMLLAIGYGLGAYLNREKFNGQEYAAYMAAGLLGVTCMYTAAFEAAYGTFIRLRFQKTYEGMIATPLTRQDIFLGELLWCGTKGALFSAIVGAVLCLFGHVRLPWGLAIPVVGFLCSAAFGGLSFIVTSFVNSMNHFQYYFTVVLTPMIFFSGLVFPVKDLPDGMKWVPLSLPLFHAIESFRLLIAGPVHASVPWAAWCPLILLGMTLALGALGVKRMMGRL